MDDAEQHDRMGPAPERAAVHAEQQQRQSQRSLGTQVRRAIGVVIAPRRLMRGVVRRFRVKVGR